MIKIIFLFLTPLYLFALNTPSNPYKEFDVNEKLNLFVNYFLNEALKEVKPPIPQKKELKDDGASLDPIKYELYFNYIQRLKAIKDSRAEEQKLIDEEYAGKIGFYNGKLKSLKKYYEKQENLYPLLEESINKAFKIVFGKPSFTNIKYNSDKNILTADLTALDLYEVDKFTPRAMELFVYEGNRDKFIDESQNVDVEVRFNFDGKYLTYKDVLFTFQDFEYIATFIDKTNEKIKLDLKINDDIFRSVTLGENK